MEMNELLTSLLTNPATAAPIINALVEKYKPILYSACGALFGMCEDLVNNDDTYALVATDKRKMFDAYVNAGFSEEQAMAFIINSNLDRVKFSKEINNVTNTLN